MQVHLVDGTYELFRHYYGQGRAPAASDRAAARGVTASVLSLMEDGATHVAVATDHVIESFRNDLWPGYKTGAFVPDDLRAQFGLVEDALAALGVVVWPMVELEADDALASAAALAERDGRVEQVLICSPDKDLSQCVLGGRVVQLDRRRGILVDEDGVVEKFGVRPGSIPDWLALVGDAADGFPGIRNWGKRSAAAVLARYGALEAIPDSAGDWDPAVRGSVRGADRLAGELAASRSLAELFKGLATLRLDASVPANVDLLEWRGPDVSFGDVAAALGAPSLLARAEALAAARC